MNTEQRCWEIAKLSRRLFKKRSTATKESVLAAIREMKGGAA